MAFKFVLLAALVSCASCAYLQQESAATPSQIAFAQSQDYDQTGPGAKQAAQPQSYLQFTQQQPGVFATFPQEFTQSSHPQDLSKFQGFGQQQHFAQQPPFAQPQTYTLQQSEPQVSQYSGPSQFAHAQPQLIQYSAQPQYSGVQQFSGPLHYSGQPQGYSQASVSYQPQPQPQPQPQHLQASQYESTPQQYSFNAQDALNSDAKVQYTQDYNGFQQQSAPKGVSQQQPQPPAYVAPKVRANQYAQQAARTYSGQQLQQQAPKIPQQYYTTSKRIPQGSATKPLYASPVSKFASPSGQHFQFSR